MKTLVNKTCENCSLKCDIYLTAKEMKLTHALNPTHIFYKKQEIICRQDEPASHVVIMLEGFSKLFACGINNKNLILFILMPSNYIGLLSVFGSTDYLYNVAALTDCTTCHISLDLISELYHNNHSFHSMLNQSMVNTVNAFMKKLVSLNQKQIRGKVAESLLYLEQVYGSKAFTIHLTRKELGELSSISEENVVRILSEFNQEGIIKTAGKQIELLDDKQLARISQYG